MSSPKDKNERQDNVIAALLVSPTHEAAAKAAGVSIATVQRHLRDASFLKAYLAARRRLVEAAIGRLQNVAGKAVEALERNLTCGKAGDEVRAAVAVLEHCYRGQELIDIAERLELVEQALKGNG